MERLSPQESYSDLYKDFISLCVMADEGGMRAIWTGEHHGMEFTIAPNPFITLTDLAHHTRNVRLGTGTVIAPFWHPIALAGEAAMTDLVTGGRLELGLARGAYSYEYERIMPGMDAWEAGSRMRETAPLFENCGQATVPMKVSFIFSPQPAAPHDPSEDGPPIWIAARDPNSHSFAVENGFNVQVTPLWQGMEEISSLMERFDTACAAQTVKRPKIMLLHHAYVGRDEDDVITAANEMSRFYNYFGAWFQNKRPVVQGQIEELTETDFASNTLMAPENLRRDLTMGTSRQVIDQLKRYEDLGYDEFSFWIDCGIPFERKKASLDRFINDVMPAFA